MEKLIETDKELLCLATFKNIENMLESTKEDMAMAEQVLKSIFGISDVRGYKDRELLAYTDDSQIFHQLALKTLKNPTTREYKNLMGLPYMHQIKDWPEIYNDIQSVVTRDPSMHFHQTWFQLIFEYVMQKSLARSFKDYNGFAKIKVNIKW